MIPYASFSYFELLAYVTIPTVILGLFGRLGRWPILLISLVMLALQYGAVIDLDPTAATGTFSALVLYALYQGAIVKGFLLWKAHRRDRIVVPLGGDPALPAVVALSLLPLLAVKLAPAVAGWVDWLPQGPVGFLGISYLTFRTLDVLFGIQDGLIKELSLRDFWLFLLFFPTVASGPVDRIRRFLKDVEQPRTRQEYLGDLNVAVDRIFHGLVYKFLIAYGIKLYWMTPSALSQHPLATVSYMYAYSLYLFFDFAGYSAFAVGVSRIFGVKTPGNFDRPFLAQNIRDFWNRWHISLSFWFRDHVYMRFVMWATRHKLLANKYAISYLGFVLSMGLMGFWHGLQPHYIVYGFYHAGLIIGYDWLSRWNKRRKLWGEGPAWRWLGVFVTFQAVCFGLLIFSGKLFS